MSDLARFPAPHVAVDIAVMTVTPTDELGLLLMRRSGDLAGSWALPGRFVRERERLADAVAAALAEKCGIDQSVLRRRTPRQLHVFDDPNRDDRGWVMSVAHLVGIPFERVEPLLIERQDLTVAPVRGERVFVSGQRRLPYGQDEIVEYAVREMRRLYAEAPDSEGLIASPEFTLAELRDVHSAVLGAEWQIDTFRRHMLPMLDDTGLSTSGRPGRPASLYRISRGRNSA